MKRLIGNVVKIIDKASVYAILQMAIRVFSGPMSIYLIATKLPIEQQAIYYIFISVSALQWVFELGMSTCLIQRLSGERCSEKVKSLINVGTGYFLLSSIITYLAMTLYCFWVLGSSNETDWLSSWLLYASTVSLIIVSNVLFLIEESQGSREYAYKSKFYSGVLQTVFLISSLYLGAGLYSLAISGAVYILSLCFLLRGSFVRLRSSLESYDLIEVKSAFKEILPHLTKTSFIWVSGYFYWNFYNVYIYKYVSIELSAQFGLSNAILSAISFAMIAFLQTKRTNIGELIFDGKKEQTYKLFFGATGLAIFTYSLLSIVALYIIFQLGLEERVLTGEFLYSLVVIRLVALMFECLLIYLRCFRDEPLVKITTIFYVLIPASAVLSNIMLGVESLLLIPIVLHCVLLLSSIGRSKRFVQNF